MNKQLPTRFLDPRTRVRHGRERERQIADALKHQAGLPIEDASEHEDKHRKIDRWIIRDGQPVALQIKYRETGEDLLFEVYDKFFGWDHAGNKVGRDMIGDAREYAVLLQDRETVVIVPTAQAKALVNRMVDAAKELGFTHKSLTSETLVYNAHGKKLELKIQKDPGDGRPKMVAYIPASYFAAEHQAEVYKVRLPANWK